MSTWCVTIRNISQQLKPTDPGIFTEESTGDPVIAAVMRYIRIRWLPKETSSVCLVEASEHPDDDTVFELRKPTLPEDSRVIAASLDVTKRYML